MNKSCATPAKKNSKGLKKDHGKSGSENFNQQKLAKKLPVCKHEQVSPIKYGTKPSSENLTGSSKFKVTINNTVAMKLDGVSLTKELNLEKSNNLRQV